MIAFGYKAGIGTASRLVPELGATLGVLLLANFGIRRDLVMAGVPIGPILGGTGAREEAAGSCIAVVATDAALGPHELTRVARRCGLGLARVASVAYDGSCEIFLALGTRKAAVAPPARTDLDQLFVAAVEATEEAVLNALWAAPDVVGRDGRVAPALPHDEVLALLEEHSRLG